MNKEIIYHNKCRTCLGQSKGMQSLGNLANVETPLTFADLLKEVVNVTVKDDKSYEMPQHICIYCSRKLKSSHAFIKQAQEVNEKLWTLLNPKANYDQHLDCLEESEIDIEKCLEIKMESNEDYGIKKAKNVMELSSVKCGLQLMTVKEEEDSISEDVFERDTLKLQKERNVKCYQLEKMDGHIKAIDSTHSATDDVKNVNDSNEFKKLNNINTEADRFNGSNNSLKEIDNTLSDADDDKFLSSIKADILMRHDSINDVSKVSGAPQILRNPKKKITQKEIYIKNEDDDIAVPCQKCNKIFNNSKELSTHLRYVHIPEDQKCACPECGATFTRTSSMYTHMRTFHETEYLQIISPSKVKEHECERCHRKYSSKKYLKYHIKLKHTKVEETNEHILQQGKVRPLCSICGASFCSKVQLVIHMRRHTGEKPFKCELCDRCFLQNKDLKSHRRIHTGEKPYKCKICEKAFRVSTKLANHMRSHTDERPYKCLQCERSFKYSKDLTIHHRIHTGERPYSCNVCGNTFTQSNSLKTHRMKLGHSENSV